MNYDTKNWQLIIDQLNRNHNVIHTVNRAQLLDDSLNLARATLLPYDLAFSVTQYLKDDDEYLPWESFLNAFSYISTMLLRSPSYGLFKVSQNPKQKTLTFPFLYILQIRTFPSCMIHTGNVTSQKLKLK